MSFLKIENLQVCYNSDKTQKINKKYFDGLFAVQQFNLNLEKGESVGIIGESGCGKTSILSTIMGILPNTARVFGHIEYKGNCLLNISKTEYDKLRWNDISIVFQNSIKYLNPSLTIFEQISEVMKKDKALSKKEKIKKLESIFVEFELDTKWLFSFPRNLSGGMLQKVFIIMALVAQPDLLLIDEPTTALESIGKMKLIKYLKGLRDKYHITMIIVSHDLKIIESLTDRSIVMYKGYTLEKECTSKILCSPNHPYTRALINASHDINPYKDLWGIQPLDLNEHNGCAYYNYCTQRIDVCKTKAPTILNNKGVACHRGGIINLFSATNISKTYYLKKKPIIACLNCSIKLRHGEILSIIGQSGSGKTTLSKILAGIISYDSGIIQFNNDEFKSKNNMNILNGIQIIFQDTYTSVNPIFTIRKAILEPLEINSIYDEQTREKLLDEVLKMVGLNDVIDYNTKADALSGGQIQRVAIARALIMKPKLLIADEITSGLDISNKVNLLRLLKGLQNKNGFSMIFVTHDLRMAQKISDTIAVMHNGKIIEQNNSQYIFETPQHPYTKKLLQNL